MLPVSGDALNAMFPQRVDAAGQNPNGTWEVVSEHGAGA